MRNTEQKFFERAKQVAALSDANYSPTGCVAVYRGVVIAAGCNSQKTHPMQDKYNRYRGSSKTNYFIPKIHAEINVLSSIRHMDINFSKVDLYIYRICSSRPMGISRPCPSCMAAIKDFGIRNIYYTTDDGFAHEYLAKGGVA